MGPMRLLLVEDNVGMAAAVRRGLRLEGIAVDVARDAAQAMALLRGTAYEAVLLDVMLPGIDGFEACRRLRAHGVWVPIIMLTARDGVDDRVRGLDEGADDYLTKPFSLAELLARVRALLRRARASARPCCVRATCTWTRPPGRSAAEAPRSSCPRASSPCWRRSCAIRGRSSARASCSKPPGTWATSSGPTSSRSTSATCARRSTGRSAWRRWRRCAGSATGCARTVASEPATHTRAP